MGKSLKFLSLQNRNECYADPFLITTLCRRAGISLQHTASFCARQTKRPSPPRHGRFVVPELALWWLVLQWIVRSVKYHGTPIRVRLEKNRFGTTCPTSPRIETWPPPRRTRP
jgi:hypothetical protein